MPLDHFDITSIGVVLMMKIIDSESVCLSQMVHVTGLSVVVLAINSDQDRMVYLIILYMEAEYNHAL